MNRRKFLIRGAVATGTLTIGGVALRFGWLLDQTPKAGLQTFTDKEAEILEAVLTTFFPGAEGMPPANVAELVPRIDAFLTYTDEDARVLFRSMLHAVEEQAAVFRFTRFTKLTEEERAEEIRAWELTPIYLKKASFKSVKVIAGSFYAEQDDVRAALGWYLGCQPAHLGV